MKWLAIYTKLSGGADPFDCEVHGWEVEAVNSAQALEILEQRPEVPYRLFLIDVIPRDTLEEWQRELEPRHWVKIHR